MLDSLCQGEGLAGAIGPNDENRGQGHSDGCGYSQDGLFLLCIQTGIQLLIPLPEGGGRIGKYLEESLDQLLINVQTLVEGGLQVVVYIKYCLITSNSFENETQRMLLLI